MPEIKPMAAEKTLDTYFLEARCKLLDLAGILDRIGRGRDGEPVTNDPRLAKMREALKVLLDGEAGRAERIQQIFSLAYDPNWVKPQPR